MGKGKKMKLLIFTQKIDINDDVLGFFHDWVLEFAEHCEKITVICLQKGKYQFPENVNVLSLGKENGKSRLKYIKNFYKYILKERNNYDNIFIHMNQIYVILGGLLWKLMCKKIGFWYAHGHVPFSLKVAEKLTDIIFTSTKSGFRLKSKKTKVVGQAINVQKFKPSNLKSLQDVFKIISIGRISPVKDYETLIKAASILKKQNINFKIDIIGRAGTPKQGDYLRDLKKMVSEESLDNNINFIGPIANQYIIDYLQSSDLFVNTSHTGSLDKAILEAMACGLPILTCNEALLEVLGDYVDKLMYKKVDFRVLANKIKYILNMQDEERQKLGMDLRQIVVNNHSINNLISKIIQEFKAYE